MEQKDFNLALACPFEVLDRSATFAMSLGAKELFHTNFLAFLLESQDACLAKVQIALRDAIGLPFEGSPGETTWCAVWREKKHFDLVVVPLRVGNTAGDLEFVPILTRGLVIEAKLKSVPRREQLDEYSKALEKGCIVRYPTEDAAGVGLRLKHKAAGAGRPRSKVKDVDVALALLSLEPEPIHRDWQPLQWQAIADALTLTCGDATEGVLGIVGDYARSLTALLAVIQCVRGSFAEHWANRGTATYGALNAIVTSKEFGTRRIRDLMSKIAYDAWLKELVALCAPMEDEGLGLTFEGFVHFSNGKPAVGLEYKRWLRSGQVVTVGLQVQGLEFRRLVATKTDEPHLESFVSKSSELWNDWLGARVAGKELFGLRGKARVAQSIKDHRCTNLKVFNAQRCVFTATGVAELTLEVLSDEAKVAMTHARQVILAVDWSGLY